MMTLEEVQKEIVLCKDQLAKAPIIERRMHFLLGMEEVLKEIEDKKSKTEIKVAQK